MIVLDHESAIDKMNEYARRERARKVVKKLMAKNALTMSHHAAIKRIADDCDLPAETVRLILRDEREQAAWRAVL